MQHIGVVALYIGLNCILLLVLAYNVGSRRGAQNALEPGAIGDVQLMRAIRAHGNYSEYAPLALLTLLVLALAGLPAIVLHVFGGGFTLGRVVHAIGMMQPKHPNGIRFAGNLVTGLSLLIGGLMCIGVFAGLWG